MALSRGNLGSPNLFRTIVDGSTLFNQSNVGDQDWTLYSFTFVAGGSSTDVKFEFQNPPHAFVLDDVSLEDNGGPATPEPSTIMLATLAMVGLTLMKRRWLEA